MKHVSFLLFFALPMLFACDKLDNHYQPIDPINPIANDSSFCDPDHNIKILWSKPIGKDTTIFYNGLAAIGKENAFFVIENGAWEHLVQARDLKTGALTWTWDDSDLLGAGYIENIYASGDYLVVEFNAKIFVIRQSNGELVWKNVIRPINEYGYPRITIINDMIYFKFQENQGDIEDYTKLYRTPITHYAPELIYQANFVTSPGRDSGYILGIECGAMWQKPNGDSILIFQTRGFRLGTNKNRADLYGFNLRTRTVEWRIDSIDGKSTVHDPLVKGNYLYFQGAQQVSCVDLMSGTLKWQHFFLFNDEQMFNAKATLGDKYLYVQPGASFLYALNLNDGTVAWRTEKVSCCGPGDGKIPIINDNLYFVAAPNFVSVSAVENKINWKCPSPSKWFYSFAQFEQYTPTIQIPGTNTIITWDNYFIMALEVL